MESEHNSIDWKKRRENFFENLVCMSVNRDEFARRLRVISPELSDERIARARGYWYTDKNTGKETVLVKIGEGGVLEEYAPYVFEHEQWESFLSIKDGFNLYKRSFRELQNILDKKFSIQQGKPVKVAVKSTDLIFENATQKYSFDHKHEFAIWKEYLCAQADKKLEDYHSYIMQMRAQDLLDFANDSQVVEKTNNDIRIRRSIYSKLTQGTNHHFLRDLGFKK